MRKIWKFRKASRRKKKNNKNNLNQYNNRKSSVGTIYLNFNLPMNAKDNNSFHIIQKQHINIKSFTGISE